MSRPATGSALFPADGLPLGFSSATAALAGDVHELGVRSKVDGLLHVQRPVWDEADRLIGVRRCRRDRFLREVSPMIMPSFTSVPAPTRSPLALLQIVEDIWRCDAGPVCDQRTCKRTRDFAHPFRLPVKERAHDNRATHVGQEFAAPPDQVPAGKPEFQPQAPIAVVMHVGHLSHAGAQFHHHYPDKVLRHVDREPLHRLHELTVEPLAHGLRIADHQRESLVALLWRRDR